MYQGLVFNKIDEKTMVINIDGVIGMPEWLLDNPSDVTTTKEKMRNELKALSDMKAEKVFVNINSPGGDVNHGFSIHDLLAESKAEVHVKINGMTASAATIIAMAAKKENRKMSDNSLLLVHLASTIAMGNKKEIGMTVEDLDKVDDRILNIYVKSTGTEKEKLQALMDENNGLGKWITAEEAKDYGFIGEVFEPMQAAAFASKKVMNQFNMPALPSDNNNIEDIIEKTSDSFFDKIKKLFENQKPKIDMKKFENLTNLVGEMKVDDKGVLLNQETLEKIENALGELEASKTHVINLTKERDDEKSAKLAAEKITKTNLEAFDAIDETVAKAETVEAKVQAINTKIAEKPATDPSTPRGGSNGGADDDKDIDWDTINNLPHNKEFDDNF